jgi:hypothetical protein
MSSLDTPTPSLDRVLEPRPRPRELLCGGTVLVYERPHKAVGLELSGESFTLLGNGVIGRLPLRPCRAEVRSGSLQAHADRAALFFGHLNPGTLGPDASRVQSDVRRVQLPVQLAQLPVQLNHAIAVRTLDCVTKGSHKAPTLGL